MMRFQTAIASGLAAILVPAVFLGQGSLDSLEDTLARTTRALEVLAGIEEKAEAGDPQAIAQARSVTEPPMLDDRGRDERLVDLRNQVNLLQGELDVLEAPAFFPEPQPPASAAGADATSLPAITTGLSPDALQAMSEETKPPAAETLPPEEPAAKGTEGPPAYSADPVAQARAAYFARRYELSLVLVQDRAGDPEALFWKSRALEKLGKLDEAVEAMKRSAELAGEGAEGRRARSEVEFLEWRRSFLSDAPHRSEGGSK